MDSIQLQNVKVIQNVVKRRLVQTATIFILGILSLRLLGEFGCSEFDFCSNYELLFSILGSLALVITALIVFALGIDGFRTGFAARAILSTRYQVAYWIALVLAITPALVLIYSFIFYRLNSIDQSSDSGIESVIKLATLITIQAPKIVQ